MPQGKDKSNSRRKVFKTTPGAKRVVHRIARKPSVHKCAECGNELKGIPRLRSSEAHNTAKTKKRPERPYGGYLCSACARKRIIQETRRS